MAKKNVYSSSFNGTILTSPPIQIGTSDFSIEYYGNAYGSGSSSAPLLFNKANLGTSNAPQLPEANGILPPLDASVGGYDLAAKGNPKIVV